MPHPPKIVPQLELSSNLHTGHCVLCSEPVNPDEDYALLEMRWSSPSAFDTQGIYHAECMAARLAQDRDDMHPVNRLP